MSESRGDAIPIADMDIVYLVRAFKKSLAKDVSHVSDADLIKQNNDLIAANKTLARLHDAWKEKAMNMVEKSTYQGLEQELAHYKKLSENNFIQSVDDSEEVNKWKQKAEYWRETYNDAVSVKGCLLYTSPSPRDGLLSRMPSSA